MCVCVCLCVCVFSLDVRSMFFNLKSFQDIFRYESLLVTFPWNPVNPFHSLSFPSSPPFLERFLSLYLQ